jgi:hypothetical protein
MHQWRGRNAAQISRRERSSAARRRKTNRQPLLGEVVSPSSRAKTIVWPTYRGLPRGKVSLQMTKTNRQPLLGGGDAKSVTPVRLDETMANLPLSTLEGSKSNEDPDGWRIVAIHGTGSRAPGSTDGHNPRSSWPCVNKVPVGNNRYKEGGDS